MPSAHWRAMDDIDPGPIDGQMGPRTEAALRAFQTEQGQAPNGQLDEATLERLAAP